MNSEIPLLSLRDAGVKLIDCVHKTPAGVDQGFPYIAIPQLTEGRIDVDSARRISERDMLEWNIKCDPQEDDIVLSRRCNPGVTAVVPKEFRGSLGQNLVLLRATDPNLMEPKYLRWVTRGSEWWNEVGRYINVGAVFESLRCADIPEFAIPVPPVAEQQAIAHILGTLDDKIELNRKTNETLEAMANALFKSWFVDFDPVRAKAEGRPTGLQAEISDLFPDSFEDSELGEIPSGWRVRPLSDIFSIQGGSQPPAKTFVDIPGNGYVRLLQIRDFIGDNHLTYVPESKNLRIVGEDDVLIGRYGSGSGRFMDDSLGRPLRGLSGAINVAVVKTLPRQKNMIELIYCMVLSGWFYRQIVGGSSRAVQAGFRKEDLDLIPFPLPPNSILDAFQEIGSKFWHRTKALDVQTKSLCQIRDALLPKLISGEIRIPDAEKMLEEVGV